MEKIKQIAESLENPLFFTAHQQHQLKMHLLIFNILHSYLQLKRFQKYLRKMNKHLRENYYAT